MFTKRNNVNYVNPQAGGLHLHPPKGVCVNVKPDVGVALGDLAGRVHRLRPSHRDPEAFHVEKSEIAFELHQLARALDADHARAETREGRLKDGERTAKGPAGDLGKDILSTQERG